MARFLISTMPASGHVNPAVPLARRLVERGHEVRWHTGTEFREQVEATGARLAPRVHAPGFEDLRPAGGSRGPSAFSDFARRLFVDPSPGQLCDYRSILDAFPADVLVHDGIGQGPALLADGGGPPWATLGISPLMLSGPDVGPFGTGWGPARSGWQRARNTLVNGLIEHLLLRPATEALNRVRIEAGVPPLARGTTLFDVLLSPHLHLQCTVPSFEYPRRRLPAQIRFVGPMPPPSSPAFAAPAWWADLDGGRPVVHVTQGTVATDASQLIGPALRGLAGEEVLVVATTPDPGALGEVPANARVATFLPHSALLPRVDVLITNGGYGGVQAALAAGVPMVAAGASQDKPEVCRRIAWAGVGVDLGTGSPTPEQIGAAVRTVLAGPSYRAAAGRMHAECRRHDAAGEASLLLERLAGCAEAEVAPVA
ncbi:MAG TPA: glycosyltransferase [Candidatus Dormibacteraeota bacterium]|jgi:UDP:flavonoid glycosyltransferase YjiC (YdhE family)|nr:glycosyltransferase [Candidatus Dormibacteraeota bacterium]